MSHCVPWRAQWSGPDRRGVHDLGLTEKYHKSTLRFEVDGVDAARLGIMPFSRTLRLRVTAAHRRPEVDRCILSAFADGMKHCPPAPSPPAPSAPSTRRRPGALRSRVRPRRLRRDRSGFLAGIARGAVDAPKAPKRSGIGGRDHLRRCGLPVVARLPGIRPCVSPARDAIVGGRPPDGRGVDPATHHHRQPMVPCVVTGERPPRCRRPSVRRLCRPNARVRAWRFGAATGVR